ncbi:MAG: recombinase family protein [Selenomonadaceae bacterium]|nr:recombinase family protein [Selenomonadaceae bacterium]
MRNKIYGYIRISTREQNDDRQRIALENFGVPTENFFIDKQSGKDFVRPQYRKLLKKIKAGDTLVIKSIDRLGRSYEELLEQWRIITKEKNVAIVVLDTPLLDTRRKNDLIGTLIADLVLQIMSAFAQIERDLTKQRQAEGIAAAKARGVKFGRPGKVKPQEYPQVYAQWKENKISARETARILGVHHSTFLNWARNNG